MAETSRRRLVAAWNSPPPVQTTQEQTALHYAAATGSVEVSAELLSRNADPNLQDSVRASIDRPSGCPQSCCTRPIFVRQTPPPKLAGRQHPAAHGCVSWPCGCCEAADRAWRHRQLQDHGALPPPPPSPRALCRRRTLTNLARARQNGWNVLHTVAASGHKRMATALLEHTPALMHERDFVRCPLSSPPSCCAGGGTVRSRRSCLSVCGCCHQKLRSMDGRPCTSPRATAFWDWCGSCATKARKSTRVMT